MKIQTLILSILFAFVISELQYLPNEDTFLGLKDKAKVRIKSNCDSKYEFQNSRAVSKPDEVSPGGEMNLKVIGQGTKHHDSVIIRVEALLNDQPAYNREFIPQNKEINVAKDYFYEFTNPVPAFVPKGNFKIYVYLVEKDVKLSCLLAEFDFK